MDEIKTSNYIEEMLEDIKRLLSYYEGYIDDCLGGFDKENETTKEFHDLMNKYDLTKKDLSKYYSY